MSVTALNSASLMNAFSEMGFQTALNNTGDPKCGDKVHSLEQPKTTPPQGFIWQWHPPIERENGTTIGSGYWEVVADPNHKSREYIDPSDRGPGKKDI